MASVVAASDGAGQFAASALDALRVELVGIVDTFMAGAADRNRQRSEAATLSADGSLRRAPAPPPRPALLALSPGVGKTTTLAAAVAGSTTPVLVLTPLSAEAGTWRGRLQPADRAVALHQPRRRATDGDVEQTTTRSAPAGVCWRMTDVQTAGAANHVPSAAVCRACPHGLRSQWLGVERGSEAEVGVIGRIDAAMAAHPDMPDPLDPKVPTCGYLPAVKLAAQGDVLVATAAAFTPTMLTFTGPGTPGTVKREDRALIVDEAPPLMRHACIDAQAAGRWLTALCLAQITLRREREQEDTDELGAIAQALGDVHPHLSHLHAMLADGQINRSEVEEIAAALQAAAKAAPTGSSISAARWETVKVRWTKSTGREAASAVEAVLRAAIDLGWAAQHGALRLVPATVATDGTASPARIELSAPTQLGEELVAISTPTIIADATAGRALRAVVEAQGGTIHNVRPALPVSVQRDSTRGWGRGRGGRGAQRRIEREAWELVVRARKMERTTKTRPVILAHKPWAELIVSRGWWPKRDVGWWGADDRAHDRWAGRDMLIAGVPSLSPEAAEDLYRADRALALAAGAPGEDWPDWTPERVERDGRTVSASPAIQAWDDDRVAGHLAQGVGRCRPLDHPACKIVLLGPCISLEDHGITVVEADPEGGSGATERRQVARLGRLLRLAEAALRLEGRGQKVTRAALRAEGAGGRSDLYSELRAGMGQAGSARNLAARLRAELAEARAASGWKVETTRSEPDAAGLTRVLVRAVPDEHWLAANTRHVVRPLRRPPDRGPIPVRSPTRSSCTAQGP